MTKIRDPKDFSRFNGMIKEGATALGGIRRKRAPLMDSLVNAAEEESERPKKIARQSMPAASKSVRRQSYHAGPVEQRAPGTPVQIRMLVAPNSGNSHHSDSSSEDSLLLKPTPKKLAVENSERFNGNEMVGRMLFRGDEAAAQSDKKTTMEHRPRVLGAHRPTSSVSSIPRTTGTSSFAAPTRASLMKQSKTAQQPSIGIKPSQQTTAVKRPTSHAPSSSLSLAPHRKPTVTTPFSFSAPRLNVLRTELNVKPANGKDLASIVETTGNEDVEMEDVSVVDVPRASHLTDRERLAIRQRVALGASSHVPSSRPSSSVSRLPLPVSHAPLAKSSAPPSLPTARKPSYPAGLGSGPLARPVSRVVSNPLVQRQSDQIDGINATPSQRSVSDPLASSTLSTSRSQRIGLNTNSETSKSLYGLSAALAKLQMKKTQADAAAAEVPSISRPRPVDGSADGWSFAAPTSVAQETPGKWVTAARATKASATPPPTSSRDLFGASNDRHAVRKSVGDMRSLAAPPPKPLQHPRDSVDVRMKANTTFGNPSNTLGMSAMGSLTSLMGSSAGEGCLRGVTAFVDVRTSEGDDSSAAFVDMLKTCGAKVSTLPRIPTQSLTRFIQVLQRPSESCTHIVYKSGKPSTLQWLHKQDAEDRPFVVGVKWVAKCKEVGFKVDEKPYEVAIQDEAVFHRVG